MNKRVAMLVPLLVVVLALVWALTRDPADPPAPSPDGTAVDEGSDGSEGGSARPAPRGDRRWSGGTGGSATGGAAPAGSSSALSRRDPGPDVDPEEPDTADEQDAADDDDSGGELFIHSVDFEGIQGAIQAQLEDIRGCYQAWVAKNPDIEGKIVLGFTIEADEEVPGEAGVRGVEIKDGSTVDHVFLEGCVMGAVEELRFEPPADGGVMTVNYPFLFSAE